MEGRARLPHLNPGGVDRAALTGASTGGPDPRGWGRLLVGLDSWQPLCAFHSSPPCSWLCLEGLSGGSAVISARHSSLHWELLRDWDWDPRVEEAASVARCSTSLGWEGVDFLVPSLLRCFQRNLVAFSEFFIFYFFPLTLITNSLFQNRHPSAPPPCVGPPFWFVFVYQTHGASQPAWRLLLEVLVVPFPGCGVGVGVWVGERRCSCLLSLCFLSFSVTSSSETMVGA